MDELMEGETVFYEPHGRTFVAIVSSQEQQQPVQPSAVLAETRRFGEAKLHCLQVKVPRSLKQDWSS
jgi:hypothetical protein